jgi:hypothetical protein
MDSLCIAPQHLTLATDGVEWSDSHPCLGTYWMGGWMRFRDSLDATEETKVSYPGKNKNLVGQVLAHSFTDCVFTAYLYAEADWENRGQWDAEQVRAWCSVDLLHASVWIVQCTKGSYSDSVPSPVAVTARRSQYHLFDSVCVAATLSGGRSVQVWLFETRIQDRILIILFIT